jgi:hypothetical protein
MNLRALLEAMKGLTMNPPPPAFAIAACNDFLLRGGWEPLPANDWQYIMGLAALSPHATRVLTAKGFEPPFHEQTLCWIAHLGRELDLFGLALQAPESTRQKTSADILTSLFQGLRGLPPSLLATSVFRQEEFLRRWALAFDLGIDGENAQQSQNALQRLDYLHVLIEASRAEHQLNQQVEQRERALRELRAQQERNRSSYE